jgi:hypothetical protein
MLGGLSRAVAHRGPFVGARVPLPRLGLELAHESYAESSQQFVVRHRDPAAGRFQLVAISYQTTDTSRLMASDLGCLPQGG